MEKYISLTLVMNAFSDVLDYDFPYRSEVTPRERIEAIPAADVVEVVRCKDCQSYYKDSDGYEMCDNSEGYEHISADGFCAWAKRRADNG